uniref:Uncharacterized protein n=2 Tax=Alexandrium monilatum TaxID=311494 RepID=A0A7S4Q8P7_9DINO
MAAVAFRVAALLGERGSSDTDGGWTPEALRRLMVNLGMDEQRADTLASTASAELGKVGSEMNFVDFLRWLFAGEADTSATGDPADPSFGHSLRGVSVHHLSTELTRRVEAAGLNRESKIYEFEPKVIRPAGERMWCPRDQQLGAAYVDTLRGADDVGMATIMLSYTWGYRLRDITDSLDAYCQRERLDPKRVYVWICCLCINQHKVVASSKSGSTISFEVFQEEFGSRVRNIGHVVPLMAPWENPFFLSRVWCVFEMYKATSENVKTTIIMPPQEEDDFRKALRDQTGMDEVWKNLGNVDAETAQASVEADRKHIMALIAQGPGFTAFNSRVVSKLKGWMVDSSEGYLSTSMAGITTVGDGEFLGICQSVNKMLRWTGEYDRAGELLEPASERVANVKSQDAANLLRQVGIIRRKKRNFSGAEATFQQAKAVSEQLASGMKTANGALLLMNMGILRAEQRDDRAAALFSQAEDLAAELGLLETNIAGLTYQWWGYFERRRARLDRAEELFTKALEAFDKTNALETPIGKSMYQEMGELRQAQGDLTGALEYYERALEVHTRFGLADSVEFRSINECIEDVKQRLEGPKN